MSPRDYGFSLTFFKFDAIEKQSIINIKSYLSLVLGDFDFTILMKGEDNVFCPSLYCIQFIYNVTKSKK